MNIHDIAKIHWACRRGMRELDIFLMPFLNCDYEGLSDENKHIFINLLSYEDPQLFSWFMNQSKPHDDRLMDMILLIKQRNQQRDKILF